MPIRFRMWGFALAGLLLAVPGRSAGDLFQDVPALQRTARRAAEGAFGCSGRPAVTFVTSRGVFRTRTAIEPRAVFGEIIHVARVTALLQARVDAQRTGAANPLSGDVDSLCFAILGALADARDPKTIPVIAACLSDTSETIRFWSFVALLALADGGDALRREVGKVCFPRRAVETFRGRGRKDPLPQWLVVRDGLFAGVSVSGAPAPTAEPYHWRNVAIIGTGFVPGIVYHPRERNLIYARTDIGGAYRWDQRAGRWVPLQDWVGADDWNLLGIESIGLDPSDPDRVYLAAGTYTSDWAGNGAILRSRDRGRTWQRTDLPFKLGGNEDGRSIGERLAVDPKRGNVLFFGSRHDGLWKSVDHGATWNKIESFPVTGRTNGVGIGFVIFDGAGAIFAGVAVPGTHLYRSTDDGATWREAPGQPKGFLPHHGALASDGTLYLTYGNAPGPNGMTDGAVWKLHTRSGVWTDITPVRPGSENAGRFGYAGLAVDASDPNTVMAATMDRWNPGDDIFRSTDGGKTWKGLRATAIRDSSASPYLNWGRDRAEFGHWIGDVEIDPFNPNHVMYVTGATIWGTNEATAVDRGRPTRWTVHARGIEETAVLDLISPPAGAHLISGLGDIGGFRHDDLAVSPRRGMWTNPTMNNVTALDFAEKNPRLVARVGTAGRGEKRGAYSMDGGASWTPFRSEPETSRNADQRSRSIALAADGGAFVWAAPDGFAHHSRDRGATWRRSGGLGAGVTVIADRVDPRAFYALNAAARTLHASTDGGATFTPRTTTLPAGAARLRAVPGRRGDLWLAAGDAGLWHATDAGASFQKIAGVQTAETVGFGRAAPGRDYVALYIAGRVGGVHGVFRSDDVGANWVRINDDRHRYGWIGQVVIGDPRIYGRVYLGTNGRGILYADPAPATKTGSAVTSGEEHTQ